MNAWPRRRRTSWSRFRGDRYQKVPRALCRSRKAICPDHRVDIAEPIADDLRKFLSNVRNDEAFDPRAFKVLLSRTEGIALLENIYDL